MNLFLNLEPWEQLWERGCLFLSLSTISLFKIKNVIRRVASLSTVLTYHARYDCMHDHNILINGKIVMLFAND